MIRTKCDNCRNKAGCSSCDEGQSKPLHVFFCNEIVTYRERDLIICKCILITPINI